MISRHDLPDGGESTAIKNRELRHAIYANGTCLYNELLKMQNENIPYGVRMTQNSNGELFLVAMTMGYNTTEHVEIYKASDTEGKEWELVKSEVLNGFTGVSFSISCPRNNSLRDDTVDCLAFGCYYIDSVYFTDLFKFSVKLH